MEALKPKRDIVQCMRCQQYGHSKTYCTLPPICVKCRKEHDNRNCNEPPDVKPTCELCRGEHTANYKGCPSYKKLINGPTRPKNMAEAPNNNPSRSVNTRHTFADVVSSREAATSTDPANLESSQTPQLKQTTSQPGRLELLEKLISQNAVILDLLTKVLTKLI